MSPDSLYERCIESYCDAASRLGSVGSDDDDSDDDDTTAVVCDFLFSYSLLCVAGGQVNLNWRTPNTCR